MQDFYQNEFRINPVPDNVVALTKTDPCYTLTAIARFQANEFFEQTERLPEVVLDVKRHPISSADRSFMKERPASPISSGTFADGSGFKDYSALRLDSFHQAPLSKDLFWLALDRPACRIPGDLL